MTGGEEPLFESMSFLFHRKTQAAIKWIWTVIAILVVIGMVFLYSGGTAIFTFLGL
jgi:hypothetical protein